MSSDPYSAPRAPTQTDEAELVRQAKQPVRTAIFTVALLLVIGGGLFTALFHSLLGGVVLAAAAASGLTIIFRLTTRSPKALSSAYTAGATTCPACGSVQTDQDYTRGPDGNEVLRWSCYACDHRWLAS